MSTRMLRKAAWMRTRLVLAYTSLAIGALLGCEREGRAYSTGISLVSGRSGTTCADQCHGGSAPPLIEVDFPARARVGEVVSWSVRLVPATSRQVAGGLNLAIDGGTLAPLSPGLRLEEGEITHRLPQSTADLNGDGRISVADIARNIALLGAAEGACVLGDADSDGVVSAGDVRESIGRLFGSAHIEWRGFWSALAAGTYRFWVAAVAANCNRAHSGDGVATTRGSVEVLP